MELQHRRLRGKGETAENTGWGALTGRGSDGEGSDDDTDDELFGEGSVYACIDERDCATTILSWLHDWLETRSDNASTPTPPTY